MSNKRKSDARGDVSHHEKVARYDEEPDLSCGGDWSTRPGMIIEVKMRNFMCHQVGDQHIQTCSIIPCLYHIVNINICSKVLLNYSISRPSHSCPISSSHSWLVRMDPASLQSSQPSSSVWEAAPGWPAEAAPTRGSSEQTRTAPWWR